MNATHPNCSQAEHHLSRRSFLNGLSTAGAALAGSVGSVHLFGEENGLNEALKKSGKRVILLWQAGGASQLETWNPLPGTANSGPFAPIPTDVPGTHISELMPNMAKRMKDVCAIRSMKTGDGGHGGGAALMMRGRKDEPNLNYPDIGAILSRELARRDSKVPDYVAFYTATEGRNGSKLTSSFLGARYSPMKLEQEMMPPNLARHKAITDEDHHARASLQALLNERFIDGRSATLRSLPAAYARVHGLMASEELFDISKESAREKERYGPTLFGEQVLMARRMVEAGVPFVRVARAWWDSHGQNFETHQELVPEFDRVLAALIDDLKERGLFDDVLIVAMGEFGRTPKINGSLGRDHFANAWSTCLAGCGINGGYVHGKTNQDCQEVAEDPVSAGDFIATILKAVGVDPHHEYHIGARPVPLVNPGHNPIEACLKA